MKKPILFFILSIVEARLIGGSINVEKDRRILDELFPARKSKNVNLHFTAGYLF